MLLIAPTIVHRLEFHRGEKAYVVETANKMIIAGLIVLAIAMTTAVLLVTHYLFGPLTAIITTIVVVAAFILTGFCCRYADAEPRDALAAGGRRCRLPNATDRPPDRARDIT